MFCTLKRKIATLVASGLMLASVGLFMYLTFPILIESEIKKRIILKEGSEGYKNWNNIPVPIYIHFYFFNVTNPDEVYDLKKPVLEELGPYTFREEREKVNITWNANDTISYRQVKRWYFQPDKTVGSLNDTITTLNVPMIAAATTAVKMNEEMVYFALEKLFVGYDCKWLINKTVEELLFKGYEDPLLQYGKLIMNIPYDKFGWFYERNNTDDGEFVIYTGEGDIESVGEVYTWNDLRSVPAYDPPCNMINGSAGDMWPPALTTKDKPTIFITDICRSLSFSYLKEVTLRDIKAFRYWADDTQLDNGKYNPNNKCFCEDGICLPAGGINVSSCKLDAPAVVSYPHFLFADSEYSQGVIGMKPNPQEHRMYLDLIPEMGIPIGVAARMQINIVFDKIPRFKEFANITRRTYFPMIWFSETAEAGTDVTDQLKLPLVTLPLLANIISFILVAIGSFFVLAAFVLAILYAIGKIKDSDRSESSIALMKNDDGNSKPEVIIEHKLAVQGVIHNKPANQPKPEKEPGYSAVTSEAK